MDIQADRSTVAKHTHPRATRFALKLPLRFRPLGADVWRSGEIENVSRSGILFRSDAALQLDDAIELTFSLGTGGGDQPGGTVVCEARVTRLEARTHAEQPCALAAAITRYELVPDAAAIN